MTFRPPMHSYESLLCLLLLACATNVVRAADDDFEACVFQPGDGQSLPYRLLKPREYDPQKAYPLVLFLHGAGERGTDNKAQLLHVVGEFASKENREKHPCFVVAPQCPAEKRWVEVDWAAQSHVQPPEPSVPMALTVALIQQLQEKYHIDRQRQYAIGLSMGGYGTWDILTRYPGMFAAGIPICGGADENTAPRIAKLPVWVFHGAVDSVVPTIRSRNMVAALKRAGGKPRYTEYPNCDHNSWTPAIQEPGLLPWLFSQKQAVRDDFEPRTFENNKGESLPYRLLKPKDYDPQKSYPLVLFFHGAGERGNDNSAQLRCCLVTLLDEEQNREKFPCFVVAPQCPTEGRWNDVSWTGTTHKMPENPTVPMALTIELLDKLQAEFHIDPLRRYVIGVSMGAFGTWDILARCPDFFAAAVPVCGGADESTAPRLAKLPLWVFHGDADPLVKVSRSRNMVEALKQAGGSPRYTEYPGVKHNCWNLVVNEPELLPWLFSQKRGT